MSTVIKHPVPDRVKLSAVILTSAGNLTLSPERQSARMSGCFIAVPIYGDGERLLALIVKRSCVHIVNAQFNSEKDIAH